MTLEEILYVGVDTDYVATLEAAADDETAVHAVTPEAETIPLDDPTVVLVDTTTIEDPVRTVRSIADRSAQTPVVAVVESTAEPVVVFDMLIAGAVDYVERGRAGGRSPQLVAHLEATVAESVADDMERRFQQELEARRRTERRMATVLDRIPQPVFYRDESGSYLGCNAAFEELCGQPRADIVGHGTEQLQNEDLAEICEQHDKAVLRTGETKTIEKTVTVGGDQRYFRVHKAPLANEQTGIEGVVGSVEDITERRRQEQQLREQAENLEILNSVTRHDIRNDLQVVLGMAEVLRDHVDEAGQEYLETMVTKGHHAVDITRQARDLTETMLDTDFGTDRIPLKSTLETQIDEIRGTYSKAIITVDGTIPNVSVDADGMLASVFRNILANGIQHNDSSVPRLRVWVGTTDERVTVHIADNGPGVPDERKDEIFGRGQKGLESSGTGLGLYLVDTLVDRYGGDVYVTDSEDGAEFVITLRKAEN